MVRFWIASRAAARALTWGGKRTSAKARTLSEELHFESIFGNVITDPRTVQSSSQPMDVLLVNPLAEYASSERLLDEAPWKDDVRDCVIRKRLTPRTAVLHVSFAQLFRERQFRGPVTCIALKAIKRCPRTP